MSVNYADEKGFAISYFLFPTIYIQYCHTLNRIFLPNLCHLLHKQLYPPPRSGLSIS